MESVFNEIVKLIIYFFIYSFLGWILESVYKTIYEKRWVNSGFLHGPLCPIYGVGAVIMILFLTTFKNNIILLFFVGFIVLSIWEYFVGWLLETLFKTKYWDYSDKKINLHGRICLQTSIIWGLLGVIFIGFIHPRLEIIMQNVSIQILMYINIILGIYIITDTIFSIIKITSINKALEAAEKISDGIKEKLEELNKLKEIEILKQKTTDTLNEIKNITAEKISEIKEVTASKVNDIKELAADTIDDIKENLEEKIEEAENTINKLKEKQEIINKKIYKKLKRLKKAFPNMKSHITRRDK